MKKTIFTIILAAGIFGLGAVESSAQVTAQNVLKRASALVQKLEAQKAQILFLQIDNVKQEQISTQSYQLEAGKKYVIVAIGDQDRIQDIDLVVANEDDEVVGKDNDETNAAVVQFTAETTGSYKMAVQGYKMSKKDGFYAIVICRMK
ncbi:MAG: hypothetical protein JSS81_01650 [Acidobacteria bacterium]|nr:hypothetical protein [Acidobacteriota bacterium]